MGEVGILNVCCIYIYINNYKNICFVVIYEMKFMIGDFLLFICRL